MPFPLWNALEGASPQKIQRKDCNQIQRMLYFPSLAALCRAGTTRS